MSKIKKIIKSTGMIAITVMAAFIFAVPVLAVASDMIVIFTPNPLFAALNFLPGQLVTAQIEIKNQSGVPKPVAIEAINVNDPNHFGDVLNLEIKEGSHIILNKSLNDFFSQGETYLSTLPNNASTTYDLIMTFNAGANDDYQGKVLNNFDILVGFLGEQMPETPPGQGGGAGGSSGGGGVPAGLTIYNEAEINVKGITATITWLTNYLSTSRVIWGAASEAHTFDFSNPPNYGYAHSTIDDLDKVTFHSITLTGLVPDTTYYYRVISHASPDTISRSLTFKTRGESAILSIAPTKRPPIETSSLLAEALASAGSPITLTNSAGTVAGAQFEEKLAQGSSQKFEPGQNSVNEEINQLAQAPPLANNCSTYVWVLLILCLLADLALWFRNKQDKRAIIKNLWLINVFLAIIPIIVYFGAYWITAWLLILLVINLIALAICAHKKL